MANLEIKKEFFRKSIHLTSLWIPLIYFFYGYKICFSLLMIASFSMLLIDLARISKGKFNKIITTLLHATKFNHAFRSSEAKGLSGATYMLLGAAVMICLVGKTTFICAYFILMISDTMAAIIGKIYGKHKLIGHKTKEGTIVFFISAVIIVYALSYSFPLNVYSAVIACLFTTIFELFAKKIKIDDNLVIPISFCFIYEVCQSLIGY